MKKYLGLIRQYPILAVSILSLVFIIIGFVRPASVAAATDVYPGGGLYAVASRSPGVYLDAPRSVLKVNFSSNSMVYQITPSDLCFQSGIDYSSFGTPGGCVGGQVTIQVCGSDSNGNKDTSSCWQADGAAVGNISNLYYHCNGCPGGGTGLNMPVTSDGYRTLYVMVLQNVGGLNGFRLSATGFLSNGVTQTSFTKIGFGETFSNGASYPQALMHLPLGGSGNTGNISITFKTPCNYSGGSFPIAWFDADRPPSTTPSDPDIYWTMTNNATGQSQNSSQYAFWAGTTESNFLGGQGFYGSTNIQSLIGAPMNITPNTQYTWTWHASNANNGVQFYLPFSDADILAPCNAPPNIAIYAECDNNRVVLQANDPDGGTLDMQYRITNASSPPSGGYTSLASQTVGPGVNATWPVPMSGYASTTTWRVEARTHGNTGSTWYNAVPQNYAACIPSCTATFNPTTVEQGGQLTPTIRITNNTPSLMNPPLRVTIRDPAGNPIAGFNNVVVGSVGSLLSTASTGNVTLSSFTASQMGTYTLSAVYNGVAATPNPCGSANTMNKPYVRMYGSDIAAGASAGCPGWTVATGNVRGFSGYADALFSTGDNTKGSGAQLGIFSLGTIDNGFPANFSSANLRGSTPTPATGLDFANTGVGTPGAFTSGSWCPYNYWGNRTGSSPPNLASLNANPNGSYQVTGSQTVGTQSIADGKKLAIYINGNLTITGNITYAGAGGWSAANQVASVVFVVNGTINIDKGVTQLDGIYVAQGANGTIRTCTNGSAAIATSNMFTQCNNQLVVNGSLVAQRIKFQRTYGSARDSASGESPQTGSRNNCANRPVAANTRTCASELINYSPEVYAIPGYNTTLHTDYVSSLPPIL